VQQRSPLATSSSSSLVTSVGSQDAWDCSRKTGQEHNSHNGKSEGPLQGNDLGKELPNSQSGSQERSRKADIVVLEREQEETGEGGNSPDGHIRENTAGEPVAMDHDGAVPEDHEEGEGQWHRRDGKMDQPWGSRVAEIDGSQIKEIGDEGNLGDDGMTADPEHDPYKLKDVVQNEVASHGSGRIDGGFIAAEQVPDVDNLQNPEHNPVDGNEGMAQRKRSSVRVEVFVMSKVTAEVVKGGDELQDEGQQSQDLVGSDIAPGALRIAGKRIRECHD